MPHSVSPCLIYSAVEIFEKSLNGETQAHYVKMGDGPYRRGSLWKRKLALPFISIYKLVVIMLFAHKVLHF